MELQSSANTPDPDRPEVLAEVEGERDPRGPWQREVTHPVILGAVLNVYHLRDSGSEGVDPRFSRTLSSQEQAYGPRECQVGEAWINLDTGWVTNPGYILITNEETRLPRANPTLAQVKEMQGRVLEVGIEVQVPLYRQEDNPLSPQYGRIVEATDRVPVTMTVQCLEVLPGEFQPLTPLAGKQYRLRCRQGKAECKVYVVPR